MNWIELKGIGKKIGEAYVLKDINCVFESGQVYALCGENGSGKTMLLRLISGLMYEDEGSLFYNDRKRLHNGKMMFSQGLLLENTSLYSGMTLYDNLHFLASINKKIGKKEVEEAIESVGLSDARNKKISRFSLGMKKRAMIAQSIMEKPDVLLLDEPCNGLDEKNRHAFYDLIRAEKERDAIVILSSHLKEDLEEIADEIIYLECGVMVKGKDEKNNL